MRPHRKFQLIVLAAALALAPGVASAQAQPVQKTVPPVSLDKPLPADPDVELGTLDNGVRYLIHVHPWPEKRAQLRLVIDAGSILEDEDQLGLAHFVEHMAFNGTKNFAKQEIVSFMESIGMRFGPSLNAFTSFDETVYMLTIPTDRPGVMEKAFLILEDWADNISFDPEEIDKERGVIVEEWRLGRGANARMQDAQLPVLLKDSRYATRLPIGSMKVIESFEHETLRRFYADWYRPDLMSVIAVGDFDKDVVEGLIRKHFGSLPVPSSPRPRQAYDIPAHAETLYAIATDIEATMTSVAVVNKLPSRERGTHGAFRHQLVRQLYTGMLNHRFLEITQKPDPPFLTAAAALPTLVRSKEMSMLSTVVQEGTVERGLKAMLAESERVARFGFQRSELDRQKRELMRGYERGFAERDKRPSAALADGYIQHFTSGAAIPGIAYQYELCKLFLPEIDLAEVNALAKKWSGSENRVVMLSAPRKEATPVPDEKRLAAAIDSIAGTKLDAYVDTVAAESLLEELPEGGSIVDTVEKEAFGITEWKLSNGVTVVLKPTEYKNDEILLTATSPGGTSLASDDDFVAAATAMVVIPAGGVGRFSSIELMKMLAGKTAMVRPVIGATEEMLTGNASPKDLETLLQLIYLTFTEPRADRTIFGILTSQMKAMVANQMASPEWAFSEAMQRILTQGHHRARPMTPALIEEMDLEKSLAFYKDRFADAGDFTFVFVGNIDLAVTRPLVEKYLGALPSTGRKETWNDVGIRPPQGIVEEVVRKGIEPKSRTAVVFTGPFEYLPEKRVTIRALGLVLETRLRESLREELGGTYGVGVSPSSSKIPTESYSLGINFGSDPARAAELLKSVFDEIESLKTKGPSEQQVNDVKETLLREFETSMKQNGYLLSQIASRYQLGEDLKHLYALPDYYGKLTPESIQAAARAWLDTENYVRLTLMPESETEASVHEDLMTMRIENELVMIAAAAALARSHRRRRRRLDLSDGRLRPLFSVIEPQE
jgi:zinc protease